MASLGDARIDQCPGTMTDCRYRLELVEEILNEVQCCLIAAELSGFMTPPGRMRASKSSARARSSGTSTGELISPICLRPSAYNVPLWRNNQRLSAGFLHSSLRLGQLYLLEAIVDENGLCVFHKVRVPQGIPSIKELAGFCAWREMRAKAIRMVR